MERYCTFLSTNCMSAYGIVLLNMNHILTYIILLRTMNHISIYETVWHSMKPYVGIWNHTLQCKSYADKWSNIAYFEAICYRHMKLYCTLRCWYELSRYEFIVFDIFADVDVRFHNARYLLICRHVIFNA